MPEPRRVARASRSGSWFSVVCSCVEIRRLEGGLHEEDDDWDRAVVNRSSKINRSSSGRFSLEPIAPWSTNVSTRVQTRRSMKARGLVLLDLVEPGDAKVAAPLEVGW